LNRDNAQLLFNQIFKLPVESTDAGLLAKLPESTYILPREKALPKAKPMTRWEKFAQIKGIQKKKKERMVFDEATGEYIPTWGYGGGKKDKTKDWLLEVPGSADPMEDQYAKLREEKKERVEKNKKRQKRNEEEAVAKSKGQDPRQVKKKQLQDAIAVTKRSTASLGRFDKQIEGEPKMKGMKRQVNSCPEILHQPVMSC
jgi:regulator of ribosome biosynthesis